MDIVHVRHLELPPPDEREILRYAGCRESAEQVMPLIRESICLMLPSLCPMCCYTVVNIACGEGTVRLGGIEVCSRALAKNLHGCSRAVIFAATVGLGADRLIARYSRISPAKAVCLQAVGAERIEALCDALERYIKNEMNAKLCPRFSPGYGDLSLELQEYIFSLLDCQRKIGMTLNDSLLVSPSKSVTGIIGIKE